MINLNTNPEALLTAKQDDLFTLDGHTFILEGDLGPDSGIYLTFQGDVAASGLTLRAPDYYEWIHVRDGSTPLDGQAVLPRQVLVNNIKSGNYNLS